MAALRICVEILVCIHIIKNGSPFLLRLTEDRYPFFGRVEVNMDDGNGWGTVCDDMWDDRDATVVCKSLGFISGKALLTSSFGSGTGMILMDDVNCTGTEMSLVECSFENQSNCAHIEDAGVICFMEDLSGNMVSRTYPGKVNKEIGDIPDSNDFFSLIHIIAYSSFGATIFILALAIMIIVLCRRQHKNKISVPMDPYYSSATGITDEEDECYVNAASITKNRAVMKESGINKK